MLANLIINPNTKNVTTNFADYRKKDKQFKMGLKTNNRL